MISEKDIADWHHLPVRELYKCKPRSYVKLDTDVFFFDHIDGMYSYCKDMAGNVIHLAAWTQVIPLQPKTPQSGQE